MNLCMESTLSEEKRLAKRKFRAKPASDGLCALRHEFMTQRFVNAARHFMRQKLRINSHVAENYDLKSSCDYV